MIPTMLITFREVIEASLIVATVLGILVKLHQTTSVRSVWVATLLAALSSFLLVATASIIGIRLQTWIEGPAVEGAMMIVSTLFVTWAVFALHKQFASSKMHMLSRMKEVMERNGIFWFTYIAVFREGTEIVLFLSTIYLTSNPASILLGFISGIGAGLVVSLLFFTATIRLPIYWAFRTTSVLLILFAAGLLSGGVHELTKMEILPDVTNLRLAVYLSYVYVMHWWVFVRSRRSNPAPAARG